MANDIPKIPRNVKPELEAINSLLTDMSAKLVAIQKLDVIPIDVRVSGLNKIEQLEKNIKSAARVNSQLAKSLGERAKAEIQLSKAIKDTRDKINEVSAAQKRYNQLKNKKLTKDEHKEWRRLTKDNVDFGKVIKDLNKDLDIQQTQVKGLSSATGMFAKVVANQALAAVDKLGKSMTVLAFDSLLFTFEKIKDAFLKVYDLFERTTKAVGQFNLAMGASTKGLSETRKEAWKVEGTLRSLTGGALGVGLQMWQDTSLALGFVGKGFDDIATKATLAGRAIGIGSAAAGELSRTFYMLGEGAADVDKNMAMISDAANDAGVQTSKFSKSIVAAKNFMVTFGKVGKKTFLDSAAFAEKLGVSLQSLQRFTEMTDTFQSTAEAAAKMNTVFGSSINAMELMLEQDPSKRLETVRKAFKEQGKTWEGMNRQERKFFSQTMNLTEEEAAGVLNSNLTLEEFQKKQVEARAAQVNDEKKIRDALSKTAETLFNFGQAWDTVTVSLANLIKPFLKVFGLMNDVDDKGKKMTFGQVMKASFKTLTDFIDKMASDPKTMKMISGWATDFKDFALRVKTFVDSGELKKWVDDAITGVGKIYGGLKSLVETLDKKVFTDEHIKMAHDIFGFIANNIDKIVVGFGVLKGVMGVSTVVGGLNSTIKLLGGEKGLIGLIQSSGKLLWSTASKFATAGEASVTAFMNVKKELPGVGGTFQALRASVQAAGGALFGSLNNLSNAAGMSGRAMQAGLVAAAGLAGWELGKFVGTLEVGGKSINDWVVVGYEKMSSLFDKLWDAIRYSTFGKMIFGEKDMSTNLKEAGFTGEEQAKVLVEQLKKAKLGQGDVAQSQLVSKNARLLSQFSQGALNEEEIRSIVDKQSIRFAGERANKTPVVQATTVNPPAATVAKPAGNSGPVNYAAKTKDAGKHSKDVTIVAGDVFLDGNLVGQHVARHISRRALSE